MGGSINPLSAHKAKIVILSKQAVLYVRAEGEGKDLRRQIIPGRMRAARAVDTHDFSPQLDPTRSPSYHHASPPEYFFHRYYNHNLNSNDD